MAIYDLAENVIMIASSLDNINEEYDNTDRTQNLLKKNAAEEKSPGTFNRAGFSIPLGEICIER